MKFDIGAAIHGCCRAFRPVTYLFIPVLQIKDTVGGGGVMHRDLNAAMTCYLNEDERKDSARVRRIRRDLWYSYLMYYCPFDEYFQFGFEQLSHEGRKGFVCDYERERLCEELTPSDSDTWAMFKNKYRTYERLSRYYGREAVRAGGDADEKEVLAFMERHPQFIVKPVDDSCGRGIFIHRASESGLSAGELAGQLREGSYILEELICQSRELAVLHPSSVNTVRSATFLTDHGPEILFTFLRIGQEGNVVDNGGAGGIVASIDTESGVIDSPGRTEDGRSFLFHPQTGCRIIGLQIPRWDEMKALSRELAERMPEQKYISWDFALTDRGWVIVEANCAGQFVGPQLSARQGIRRRLQPYFDV